VTQIIATCPDCGQISLAPTDVLLRMKPNSTEHSYAFTCPTCEEFVKKPADTRIVRLLLSGGVMPLLESIPAEALEVKNGPPLQLEDILTLHETLQGDDWMSQL
jgi:hypothetical protein